MKVLGVRIDDIKQQEAVERVVAWINRNDNYKLVFTPGPEFIVEANRDLEFKKVLNSSDLNIPDGFGLKFAGINNRIPGVDFMLRLCQEAERNGWKVGLLGGWEGVARETASKLKAIYPKASIPLVIDGLEADKFAKEIMDHGPAFAEASAGKQKTMGRNKGVRKMERLDKVKKYSLLELDLLFVAFGHFRQEKLLFNLDRAKRVERSLSNSENSGLQIGRSREKTEGEEVSGSGVAEFSERRDPSTPSTPLRTSPLGIKFRVGMGVGSSFDLISGRQKRPAKWMRNLGLEWLGRLSRNPRHFCRVFRATILFLLLISKGKIEH